MILINLVYFMQIFLIRYAVRFQRIFLSEFVLWLILSENYGDFLINRTVIPFISELLLENLI